MKNQSVGSDFDDVLAEEGLLEEATAVAVKRVIAWQIEQEMLAQKITKTAMAKKNADQSRLTQPLAGRKRYQLYLDHVGRCGRRAWAAH